MGAIALCIIAGYIAGMAITVYYSGKRNRSKHFNEDVVFLSIIWPLTWSIWTAKALYAKEVSSASRKND